MSLGIGIIGAGGRMGRMLIDVVHRQPGVHLAAATDRAGGEAVGRDAGELAGQGAVGVTVGDDIATAVSASEAVIDFSLPEATEAVTAACAQAGRPLVLGTTGLGEAQREAVRQLSEQVAVMHAANYSTGVTLLTALVEQAARAIGEHSDIEIIEAHHRHKVDAPSGTALRLGEAAADALGRDLGQCAVYGREGYTGERDRRAIGFETIRAGDIVGEHTVLFGGDGERVELTHKASSRTTFAAGALRAATWLVEQPPGLYDMRDLIGV
ncbi:MAG: 4-hydroxy-tetrahydrodipicolinate reductase [Halorhodospira halophila]|uniref:4-hydroxy-tetrahydrodipicolinate reductase n=1 Tax=Halorhodospira TaxID=85108 RepID=UPI001911F849|nr:MULTISPECIES: 4-hydroxy-tetrahydrodipicolinate reductase [Halorhodospira]MBK5937049.1 4-hydroxy-tetrahydrodipicolinate reductase [Halorhodospira halophila]MBK5943793.1 4-hydroxy-tetrahydrodipicolinate reductase [Halorhodospira halophila]MCC3750248.1 4-hydroxy-tetrahydrodipicolinate reductase [Halorhodospira halophila]MCG5528422.1 4-hydroxy-tetrahydrodipicolinate reductase [Halorhodospira halophila]MCG5532216.1 4-hydroxy-tetrahydrodipicolinate reductase [Halorhodospira sp. 9621]